MKGGGMFIAVVIGLILLSAVLYGKTGCFGGFWNCMFANNSSPTAHGTNTKISYTPVPGPLNGVLA